ncbi:hypothetical protein AB4156_37650 [Cupriavidus sp. 2MCAB6]|uniref:hypothetical protein n=1 Tax=Cupriavidus sp. 2MCAB6 TaxID=3232981 RepID=UPI003F90C7AA
MTLSFALQILSACIGILGSIFFAVGVVKQSPANMAELSGTYWGWNPHMTKALAAQKADYVFGGCLIVVAFSVQYTSLIPWTASVPLPVAQSTGLGLAFALTVATFFALRWLSARVAGRYEQDIRTILATREKPE